ASQRSAHRARTTGAAGRGRWEAPRIPQRPQGFPQGESAAQPLFFLLVLVLYGAGKYPIATRMSRHQGTDELADRRLAWAFATASGYQADAPVATGGGRIS